MEAIALPEARVNRSRQVLLLWSEEGLGEDGTRIETIPEDAFEVMPPTPSEPAKAPENEAEETP